MENEEVVTTPAPQETPPPIAAEAPPEPEAPLYKGITGDVKNVDDLKAYAQNLEKMVLESRQLKEEPKPTLAQPTPNTQYVPPQGETFEELIFANPNKAKDVLRKEILSELEQRDSQANAKKSFWNEFYTKNNDLKPLDRIVQSVVKERWNDLQHLPIEKAKEVIAKESRELVGLVKSQNQNETELESRPAVMFGGSGAEVPKSVSRAEKPKSLIDQLADMKRRGKNI